MDVGPGDRLHLGVIAPYGTDALLSGERLREHVRALEAAGIESIWTVEHVVMAESYEPNYPYSEDGRVGSAPDAVPMPDPLELIAFMAACTTELRFGTAVVVAPLHSAAVLAKRAATLDVLSGGRFLLGLGIGWQREEYAAVGAPFERRGLRLDECVAAMRALWSEGAATFHSESVSFDGVHMLPKPRAGRVPIIIGGHSRAAVRRAARLADGWFPVSISPDEFDEAVHTLHDAAQTAGRDATEVELTAWPASFDPAGEHDVDLVRRYVRSGARRLIITVWPGSPAEVAKQVARYRREVVDRL
jgi:probable F420-dependent oxidoreductase